MCKSCYFYISFLVLVHYYCYYPWYYYWHYWCWCFCFFWCSCRLLLNWFVTLSKSWCKLNQSTSFDVGKNDGPFFDKDCWCWLSWIFVRLIAFWFRKFFLIFASSFFLRIFVSFLFCLIFDFRFSCEYRRFFFPFSWLLGTLSPEISSVLFLVTFS